MTLDDHLLCDLQELLPPLPFAELRVPGPQLEEVDRLQQEWQADFPLGEERGAVSRAYVEHCSPRGFPAPGITLTALYLFWFFALNDELDPEQRRAAVAEAKNCLRESELGCTGLGPSSTRFGNATAAFWRACLQFAGTERSRQQRASLRTDERQFVAQERIGQQFGAAPLWNRTFGLLIQLLDALEKEVTPPLCTHSSEQYLDLRLHTIGAYPHLDIWRVVLGAPEPGAKLEAAERSAVRVILLLNDLMTLPRDLRKGKPNLALVLARESPQTIAEAQQAVRSRLTAETQTLQAMLAEVARTECDSATLRYADFLGTIHAGNRRTVLELAERYPRSSGQGTAPNRC